MEDEEVLQKTASNVLDASWITHLRFILKKGLVKDQISSSVPGPGLRSRSLSPRPVPVLCSVCHDPEDTPVRETLCAVSWHVIWSLFSRRVCFAHLYHF